MAGTTFWVANVIFFVSGPIMVLVNQQLGAHFSPCATLALVLISAPRRAVYLGGGDPEAFAGGFFQYAGFLVCQALCTIPWLLCGRPTTPCVREFRLFPNGIKWTLVKLVVPVALFDVGDKYFQLFGIQAAGSGLYIVIFSSLTVWTALIRRFGFGRALPNIKWLAVLLITAGLAVDAVSTEMNSPVEGIDLYLLGGMAAALAAALFDACVAARPSP